MNRRSVIAAGIALVVTVAATSCGFPTDGRATTIDPAELPDALRPGGAATTTSEAVATEPVDVWLVRDQGLVAARRRVPSPAQLADVIASLGAGAVPAEADLGLRSALPIGSMSGDVEVRGGTAVVSLDAAFVEVPPGDQVLALGQVVMTLTDLRGIGRVRFTVEGATVAVPLPGGTTTEDSVARDDYASLVVTR